MQRAKTSRVGVTAILAVVAMALTVTAAAREQNVERWVAKDLATDLGRKLAEHPRFKGAPLRFVLMRDGMPVSSVDSLSLRLKDSLQRKMIDTPGITVAWQPSDADVRNRVSEWRNDCLMDDVQYLIGLEVRTLPDGAEVIVRALDTVEGTWVAGIGRSWRGSLTRRQRQLLQTPAADRSFLGQRGVPYTQSETDLLAAHLAHNLRCELMRQVSGEYVVSRPRADSRSDDGTGNVLELVANNISGISSLKIAVDGQQANALLEGQAHNVEGDLVQYWLTVTPTDPGQGLEPISTSVYLRLPQRFMSATPAQIPNETVRLQSGSVLASTALVRLDAARGCSLQRRVAGRPDYPSQRRECLALEVSTNKDAVVFVLNHQQNNGLVRLGDGQCSYRPAARIARANTPITVSLPGSLLRDSWLPESEWLLEPEADTFYAIAVSDSKAARAIASHLESLPRRCTESVRLGFEGDELTAWLESLSAEVTRWQPHVDWNAIKIRNVL